MPLAFNSDMAVISNVRTYLKDVFCATKFIHLYCVLLDAVGVKMYIPVFL